MQSWKASWFTPTWTRPNLEEVGATGYGLASNNPRMSSGPRLPEKLPSSSLSTASNSCALRAFSAITLSSMVFAETSRWTITLWV